MEVMSIRFTIKKTWKRLPRPLREFPLYFLTWLLAPVKKGESDAASGPVYIMGNFQSGGGISRSAELYAAQYAKQGPCICVDTTNEMLQVIHTQLPQGHFKTLAEAKKDRAPATVIIHLNPPQFHWLLCQLGRGFLKHKRVIAYWAWELEDIPNLWKQGLEFVDAIEVPSEFTAQAIRRNTTKQVTVVPHPTAANITPKNVFGHEGKLRCLYIFDLASLCERKNPEGVIAAFVDAFTPQQATLTLKIGQARRFPQVIQQLQTLCKPYPHIHISMEWLDEEGLHNLYQNHDVYLSLHRSEGFGLTIQEAMQHGLYIVATGWSGNMDFMKGERITEVPFTLVSIDQQNNDSWGVPGAQWAEADIKAASQALQKIYQTIFP